MLQDAGGAVKEPRSKKGGMRPGGFEPPTNSLEGCCSIHLSYGRGIRRNRGGGIRTRDLLVPNPTASARIYASCAFSRYVPRVLSTPPPSGRAGCASDFAEKFAEPRSKPP